MTYWVRMCASLALLAAGAFQLTGCVNSPTYGTDKSATEQLLDDFGRMASLAPSTKEGEINYAPRPGLVVPSQTALVEPQQSLADREANPAWLESPEEARKRLKAEATANENNPHYRSPLVTQHATGRKLSLKEQQEAYREARKIQQGRYEGRRYLSDPPAEYRAVEDEALLADLGETEAEKERRRKADAELAEQGNKRWWIFWK